jgi:hypothetical protein
VEASLPGYTLQGITPAGYVSHGDQLIDPEGRVVPEMKVIPYKFGVDGDRGWLVERTYTLLGDPFTMYMQKSDIKVMENGGLDMSALQYVDGQLIPKFVIHTDYTSQEETVTEYKLISLPEAMQRLYEASVVVYHRDGKLENKKISSNAARVLNLHGTVMTCDGINFPINFDVPKGGFAIGIWNAIETVNVKTNELRWAGTLPFYWVSVEGGKYAYFGFENENGEKETYFIDNSKLDSMGPGEAGDRFYQPFTMFMPGDHYNY